MQWRFATHFGQRAGGALRALHEDLAQGHHAGVRLSCKLARAGKGEREALAGLPMPCNHALCVAARRGRSWRWRRRQGHLGRSGRSRPGPRRTAAAEHRAAPPPLAHGPAGHARPIPRAIKGLRRRGHGAAAAGGLAAPFPLPGGPLVLATISRASHFAIEGRDGRRAASRVHLAAPAPPYGRPPLLQVLEVGLTVKSLSGGSGPTCGAPPVKLLAAPMHLCGAPCSGPAGRPLVAVEALEPRPPPRPRRRRRGAAAIPAAAAGAALVLAAPALPRSRPSVSEVGEPRGAVVAGGGADLSTAAHLLLLALQRLRLFQREVPDAAALAAAAVVFAAPALLLRGPGPLPVGEPPFAVEGGGDCGVRLLGPPRLRGCRGALRREGGGRRLGRRQRQGQDPARAD
mmetsp:Transcript_77125/g.213151  ORF Transcript_77125/g.213151 Transcript_77125/m.213151 type:complete len:401 (+) Transcript_77125:1660-2862(+)